MKIVYSKAIGHRGRFKPILSGCALLFCLVSTTPSQAEDTVAPAIPGVLAAGAKVEFIKEGFDGTEGPITLPDGSVIFTETRANRITRIGADGATSTFLENTNGSNGLAFTAKGDLITVQNLKPRIGIVYPAGREKTLVENYEGAAFQRPNDLVVDQRGGVYFTDIGTRPTAEQPTPPPSRASVYYLPPDGPLRRIANDIERPNGIQLSPDERTLYVANTAGEYILAYVIADNGSVGPRKNFAKLEGFRKTENGAYSSGADGLAVDANGRLYVASTAGVQVFSPAGEALGIIPIPKPPQNLAFAGPDKKTLYVVGRGAAYKIATLSSGYNGRAK